MAVPAVSVILPTYNRAHLLPRAIASVLGQSWRDFELIVVDDGSTDDTERVVRGFDDPRVVFLPPEGNLGDAGARNRGVAVARSEWLAFQDSDDEWVSDKLAQQLAFARAQPQADVIGGSSIRVAGDRVDSHHWPLVADAIISGGAVDVGVWARDGITNLQTMMIRRSTFLAEGGFDTQFKAIADADFAFRVISQAPGTVVAKRGLVAVMYETPGSLIGNPRNVSHDLRRILLKHKTFLEGYPVAMSALFYRLALSELQCGNLSESREAAFSAIRARPASWRPYAYLCLSILGVRGVQKMRSTSQALRRRLGDVG
jgi:glycosyltransferase involved in cell wall biosynthesis